ncbi:M13 family metallopeptidase [Hymenobacter sp. BT491]|uniref:M13 family metallopeptidase n=1 Tax=Hymenobacter sp. BT491 TaxID=2766779 RepID=UPI001653CC1F|nr:M13 family metallopeptidase [Hymenobacter sp. BT491]MBC6988436.1 M13 family metallopeptidase [Hymenobacter sp. BT491]
MIRQPRLTLATLAVAGWAIAGCATSNPSATATAPAAATTPAPVAETVAKGQGLGLAYLDKSVAPCDDFFQYANGNFFKNNQIPASETAWGVDNEVSDRNQAIMRQILEDAATDHTAAKGSNNQKVGDYYGSGMDSVAIEKAGIAPIKPELDRIAAIKDLKGLQTALARQQMLRTGSVFSVGVRQDPKISTQYAVAMSQGGLSLPDRDYYLKDDARSKSIRNAYLAHLTNTLKLLGDNEATAAKNAATVVRLETRLAKASKTRVELRDPYANYNKMTVAEASQQFPNLGLPTVLAQDKLGAAKEVIVGQPVFFKEASTMLKAEPLSDWKTYLRWHLVNAMTPALPKAYVDENFAFEKLLSGAQQQQPRWKRMLRATDAALGEAFGQLYVDKAFPPESKQRMLEMVRNLQAAFAEHIQANTWMSAATKEQALKKLNAFTVKIGYPDKWKDYSALTVSRNSYAQNVINARIWSFNENVGKLGKPVDRTEWGMTPPTVNAYYNPARNEIAFPAGILQPPYFDAKADDAVNYGSIGAAIGHEMTHGFDDQGRQYDAEGNLKDWWTKEDAEKFTQRASVVGSQFDAFSPLDSLHVNGKLTMGENLADLGGLSIAYTALQKQLGGKPRVNYDGFTPEQRFFIAYAQSWRSQRRPEALRRMVLTDPHAPEQFRVNGPLQNMPEFFQAFSCKDDSKMVRGESNRALIW